VMTRFGLSGIAFADDTFTLNRKHTLALCALLKDMAQAARASLGLLPRGDLVDRDLPGGHGPALAATGSSTVSRPVAADPDLIGKGITLEQVRTAVRDSKELGIQDVLCSFMFPHPADTLDTVRAQKEFMQELAGMGPGSACPSRRRTRAPSTTRTPGTRDHDPLRQLGRLQREAREHHEPRACRKTSLLP